MLIRNFETNDRQTILEMVDLFYNSPGVLHSIPVQNFADVFEEMCNGGSQRIRGLVVEIKGQIAGYSQLSFSYSTEAGGPVVLIEEVYIKPDFQGKGIGSALFQFIEREYHNKAARLRLEVAPDNKRASALYERLGFSVLPYHQMTTEDF